ncbi:MAG: PaaI family thioesterase [Deltaproteobacteria bacterium]|nr:PaaI family thioesterase [Deltaproteobacteria bacterium]
MSTERQYALGALFGPARFDIGQFTPYAGRLRMRVVEVGPGFAILALPYDEDLVGDPQRKVVFGGAVTALIDQASGLAVACAMDALLAIATIDLRVDYLRAAAPGREIVARADCYKLGHNVAFVRATAWDTDPHDPFASCLGTFMVGAGIGGSPFGGVKRPEGGQP